MMIKNETEETLTLTIRQLAELLTMSERTVRRRVESREIPAPKKLHGKLLWIREEIRDWVRAEMPSMDDWTWNPGK